ncbi:MAG: DUF5908 family protein [Pseudomonadota bacterium]
MPIEIRELIVRARIEDANDRYSAPARESKPPARTAPQLPGYASDILRILEDKRER